ncbi:TonB-dependent receptor [Rhodovulum sp. DZ06]|uniref:TonB-dependent receptor n=1 Tax=Rhodovulum sp. DZ06 TaxID=3425126 RepID=UPI003D3298D4
MTRHTTDPRHAARLPAGLAAAALGAPAAAPAQAPAQARPAQRAALGLGLAASLGLAAPAFAQQAAPIMLPELEVEAAAPAEADGQGAAGAGAAGAAAAGAAAGGAGDAAQQAAAAGGQAPALTGAGAVGGANPFADPNAPWKVDASANSRIRTPLKDTPRTINAIPKEVLEQKGATSVRELARTTPGITLGTGEGGNAYGDVLFIRGFKATNDAFVDGVRESGVTIRENFMTEQVEILKGPSGTVGGRGVTGGAVNLVTKKAQKDDFISGALSAGTSNLWRGTLDANGELNENIRGRVNLMAQKSDTPGRDHVKDDRWGAAFSVEGDIADDVTVGLEFHHIDISQTPDWGVPWDSTAGEPATESLGVSRDTYFGVVGRDFQEAGQDVGTFRVDWDLGDGFALSNRTRLSRSTNDYVLTAPSNMDASAADPADWTASLSFKSNKQSNTVFGNVAELTWDGTLGGMKHAAIFGVEASREKIVSRSYTGLTSEDYQNPTGGRGCLVDLFDPDPIAEGCWVPGTALTLSADPTKVNVETLSAFLGDTVELLPGLSLTLGARIDSYDISKSGVGGSGAYAYARDDVMFNWNAGLTWKPVPEGTLYAAIATSTNPMGQELDAGGGFYGGLDAAGQLLAPEKNTAYELGVKWSFFGDDLLATASVFRTEKRNARETQGRGASAVTTASGEYYVQGVEFGLSGEVWEGISVFGGASLMQSEVTKSASAANVGEQLANIAHHQANLLVRWQATDDFAIGGQATWRGEIQGGSLAATNGNTLQGFVRFDAMAEYRVTENASIAVSVTNLTDETYYDAFYRSGAPFTYVAPGRSAMATLKLDF